jgi:hypothetical protein
MHLEQIRQGGGDGGGSARLQNVNIDFAASIAGPRIVATAADTSAEEIFIVITLVLARIN